MHKLLASNVNHQLDDNLQLIVNLEPLGQANPGQFAVVKCDQDSTWGRVKVEGSEGDLVKVRFLEVGSVEFNRMEEIFRMPESVIGFPAFTFLVSINSKIENNEENKLRIAKLLESGELCVVLRSDKSGVFCIGGQQVFPEPDVKTFIPVKLQRV